MSVLSVRNLRVRNGEALLVKDLNFDLISGEITALVGKSGSGKTLSALALLGFTPHNLKSEARILIDGVESSNEFAVVMQNPKTAFNPIVALKNHFTETIKASDKKLERERVEKILNEVGLNAALLKKYPFELSGGQLQRMMVALALVSQKKFIVADEPTTDLDSVSQAIVLRLFKKAAELNDVGILLITHDFSAAASVATNALVMHEGEMVESGLAREVFKTPKSKISKELLGAHLSLYEEKI